MVSELIRAVNLFTGKFNRKVAANQIRDTCSRSWCRCFFLGSIGFVRITTNFAFYMVKSGKFVHQVNSDTQLQTV